MIPQPGLEPDGTFTSIGLPEGEYVVNLLPNFGFAGWQCVSVRHAGQELLGAPIRLESTDVTGLELVLSTRATEVSGRVVDEYGRPARDSTVIAFPQNNKHWSHYLVPPAPQRVARLFVMPGGTFSAQLPPGEYYLAAALGYSPDWPTEQFLSSLVHRAVKVRLAVGDRPTVVLTAR